MLLGKSVSIMAGSLGKSYGKKKQGENFERGLTLHCPPNSICVVKKHSKKKGKGLPFFFYSSFLFFLGEREKKKRDGCLFDEGSLVWKKEQKKTWVNFFFLKGKKGKKKRWELRCWRGVALFVSVLIFSGSS